MPRTKELSQGAHVLLIDDDAPLRELVTQILTEEGYCAHAAPDGAAALALLASPNAPPVGAVLLDLRLPDMDGRAFAARYGALPAPRAPLVVFTAAPTAEAVAATEDLGAAGFVTKPFELDTLLEVIDRCLPAPGAAPIEPAARPSIEEARPMINRPPTALRRREPDPRRRQLIQLRDEVTRVQASLVRVRAAVERLVEVEATRKLTADERGRIAALRRESEALYLELKGFHQEFARLREAGRDPGLA
jgi:DNA-binding response OmpR family regulator